MGSLKYNWFGDNRGWGPMTALFHLCGKHSKIRELLKRIPRLLGKRLNEKT
jgi:hypothetical protein